MKARVSLLTTAALLLAASIAVAQSQPKETQEESVRVGQSIADAMRAASGADLAFLPSGVLKATVAGRTLDQSLEFPTEELVVVKLSGQQVKNALEKSLSLFPTSNPAYLYVSGLEAAFRPGGQPEAKVTSITVGSTALNPSSTYRVAMPASLGRGGLGYFTVWQRGAIEQDASPKTLESILSGKSASANGLRVKAAGA